MSDTPSGPGWWQASDGKWYRQELHPDWRPPPPWPTAAAAPPVPPLEHVQSAQSTMSKPWLKLAVFLAALAALGTWGGIRLHDQGSTVPSFGTGSADVSYCWSWDGPTIGNMLVTMNVIGGTRQLSGQADDCYRVGRSVEKGDQLYLSVTNQSEFDGNVTCTIDVDGTDTYVETSSGSGTSAICSGPA